MILKVRSFLDKDEGKLIPDLWNASEQKRPISSIVYNVLKLKLFSAGGRMRSEPVRECPKISSQPFSHCGTENHFKQHADRMLQALDYWLKNSSYPRLCLAVQNAEGIIIVKTRWLGSCYP